MQEEYEYAGTASIDRQTLHISVIILVMVFKGRLILTICNYGEIFPQRRHCSIQFKHHYIRIA